MLNSLLESQQNSIIRSMGEGSPYLTRATAELRRPLQEMLNNNLRRCQDLYELIEALGGTPLPRGVRTEEQYLAYLSLKFLLPKLVDAKGVIIQRYENALKAIGTSSESAAQLLERHLVAHRAEHALLEQTAADVIAGRLM